MMGSGRSTGGLNQVLVPPPRWGSRRYSSSHRAAWGCSRDLLVETADLAVSEAVVHEGQQLPGHGDAFTDRSKIDYFQAYLRDVWTEVSRLKQQGVSAEEAAKRADLTKHKDHFPIQGPGVPLIAATRIYDVIDRTGGRD